MLTVLLTGLLTTLALIVAIGPQAAFMLRQGLRRDRVVTAALVCLAGDVALILLGTLGVGAVLDHAPWLLDVIRWVGVSYLLWFAYRSFRSALKPQQVDLLQEASAENAETANHHAEQHSTAAQHASAQSASHQEALHVEMTSEIPATAPETHTGERDDAATSTRQRVMVTKVSKISTVAATGLTLSVLNPHAWVDSLVVLGTMANSFGADKWWFAAGAVLASVIWIAGLTSGTAALSKLLNRPRIWQVIDVFVGLTMLVVAGILAFSGF